MLMPLQRKNTYVWLFTAFSNICISMPRGICSAGSSSASNSAGYVRFSGQRSKVFSRFRWAAAARLTCASFAASMSARKIDDM